jgi:ABC-type transporter Mla MlaB component
MLRITATGRGAHPETLRLEGRLVGPWVAQLRSACRACSSAGQRLQLDVAGLRFVDADGAALLRELAQSGAAFSGLSPFVAALLEQEHP